MADAMDPDRTTEATGADRPAPLASVGPLPDWARFLPVALVATGALVIALSLHEPADEDASFWTFDSSSSSESSSWWSSDEPSESNSGWLSDTLSEPGSWWSSEPSEPSSAAVPVQSYTSPQTDGDDETGR